MKIEDAEKNHDWRNNILIQFFGTENKTIRYGISKKAYEEIKAIIKKYHQRRSGDNE